MNLTKLFVSALTLGLCLMMAVPANAQTNERKKEIKKVMKALPADMEMPVYNFANSKLKNKEEGVEIMDAKSLKKNFSLLSPTDQAEVLAYAKKMAEGGETLAMSQPQPVKVQPQATKPSTSTPQPVKLKPAPNKTSMVQPAPKQPATPKQPAYIEKANKMPKTTVQWYEEMHDFGTIEQGSVAKHTFKFKNVGDNELLLTRVKASCGCTTPKWSSEPIPPGGEGLIEVSFNSTGKMGNQMKSVSITHNGEPNIHHVLRFKATIVPKK